MREGFEIVGGMGGKNQSKGLNFGHIVKYLDTEIYSKWGWRLIRALRFREDFFVTFPASGSRSLRDPRGRDFLGKKVNTKIILKISFAFSIPLLRG